MYEVYPTPQALEDIDAFKRSGYWSRRINKKDRLIYAVEEDRVVVTVVQAKEHY